jgi:hypothetical protein
VLRRLISPLREFGFGAGSIYVLDRLFRMLSDELGVYLYDLMVQPVKQEPLLPPRLSRNIEFVEIGPGHADLLRMPTREDIKVSRFAQGARCLGAYRNGILFGYVWFCFGAYHEDEVRCIFDLSKAEPAAWDFDLYLFPEHRMGLGFSAIWHGAFEYLRSRGIERSFSRVSQFNIASRRAHARLGSDRVGCALFVKLWRVEIAFASLAPFIGISWAPQMKLRLTLPSPH